MAKKPLLIFPEHTTTIREKPKPGGGPESYHYPVFQEQKDRLTPQLESMRQLFITDATAGLEPESVLVIETIGKIDEFQRAVRAVPGLEWLAEIDDEEIEADEDFYQICKIGKRLFYKKIEEISNKQSSEIWEILKQNGFIDKNGYVTKKNFGDFNRFILDKYFEYKKEIISVLKDKISEVEKDPINRRLFLSMSNTQAMDKLLSLWNQWDGKGQKPLSAKWVEIFKQCKSIRPWGIQDRLSETGVVEYWKEELAIKKGTASNILFEIELWYRNDADKRRGYARIEQLISEEKGSIIASCTIDEIRFHAIKAELPPESIEKAINSEYTKIFTSNDVMFFRPVGQCRVEVYPEGEEGNFKAGDVSGKPIVAILDGVPFVNHSLLENRLMLDDPDDFGNDYQEVKKRQHGTAMASLVCHGELDAQEHPLPRAVYFRPIMKPNPDDFINKPPVEIVPKEIFLEDLIERSVRRMFAGDGIGEAVAPTVKIINLSIGDSSRMFFNQLSSGAKLLDWLSEKYQVLFCVSAGNVTSALDLQKSPKDVNSVSDEELSKLTMRKIQDDIRNRKIFAPADSINALTVGAIHADSSSIINMGNRVDVLPNQILPSPVSTHGHGFRKSIKPEIYFPGGRQLYNYTDGQYAIADSGEAPGQRVATTPVVAGERSRCVYTRGTSNSAALASRGAAQIYEVLNSLENDSGHTFDDENIAVILKALLIHSASWRESYSALGDCLKNENNSSYLKKNVARYIGYGVPDISRVLECTAQRATAIGHGKIKKDEKHEFEFPLPSSLSGEKVMRRLTMTLAWFSPINAASRKYRRANLSIEHPENILQVERKDAQWQQVKNGTVQHEVLEGSEVASFRDGDILNISVVCREDAGSLDEEVNYGLAVTLETAEGVGLPIYEEIKERIEIPIPVKEPIS